MELIFFYLLPKKKKKMLIVWYKVYSPFELQILGKTSSIQNNTSDWLASAHHKGTGLWLAPRNHSLDNFSVCTANRFTRMDADKKLATNVTLNHPTANNKEISHNEISSASWALELLKAEHINLKIFCETATYSNTNCIQFNSPNQQEFACILC